MNRLLLVRHGETEWNAAGRIQGRSDLPLNETGRWQAERLAPRLKDEKLAAAVSSDLQRACQTAQAILAHHPEIDLQTDPRLREMDFGEWDGLTFEQVRERYPGEARRWLEGWEEFAPPGGESFSQFVERVAAFYREIKDSADGTTLITAHGGSLQVLVCLALGLGPERYWQFHMQPAALVEVHLHDAGGTLQISSP